MEHILIVEDEAALQRMFATFLRSEGYLVELASTVEEAQHIIDTELIDLVVSDLKLGLKTAYELYSWLIEKYPRMQGRFIVMSGWPDVEGFPYFLAKPFRIDALLRLITSVLSRDSLVLPTRESVANRIQESS